MTHWHIKHDQIYSHSCIYRNMQVGVGGAARGARAPAISPRGAALNTTHSICITQECDWRFWIRGKGPAALSCWTWFAVRDGRAPPVCDTLLTVHLHQLCFLHEDGERNEVVTAVYTEAQSPCVHGGCVCPDTCFGWLKSWSQSDSRGAVWGTAVLRSSCWVWTVDYLETTNHSKD